MPAEFKELKIQALGLLEWALADMSPEGGPLLHFKCGFEREGHFIANDSECADRVFMDNQAPVMERMLCKSRTLIPLLRRVYHDDGGTFLLEAVTEPLGLLEATKAIDDVSKAMLEKAPELGFTEYGFGSVPATCVNRLLAHYQNDSGRVRDEFVDYAGEVFDLPGQGKTLVGRGQHCNMSLWLGDQELFKRTGSDVRNTNDLVDHAARQTMEWMPYMFLPCRNGNYHRIAAGSKGGPQEFLATVGSIKGVSLLRYTCDSVFYGLQEEGSFRLEFRAGMAETDPYDIALAAATPLVKTCDDVMKKEQGKLTLAVDGNPIVPHSAGFPSASKGKLPKNESRAAELFNVPNNPYFAYLNELAERKIRRLQETGQSASPEIEKLRNIGTRLFEAYCQQYHLEPCTVRNARADAVAGRRSHEGAGISM